MKVGNKHCFKRSVTKIMAWGICLFMFMGMLLPMTVTQTQASSKINIRNFQGWQESAFVEWYPAKDAKNYKVYYKKSGGSYVGPISDSLIRRCVASDGAYYYRADVPGISAGSYTLKVVPVINGSESAANASETTSLNVTSYVRQGFGWTGGSANGAYNNDGTIKSGTTIIYVSDANKDSVSVTLTTGYKKSQDGKTTIPVYTTFTGLANILNNFYKYSGSPLCIRVIGKVTDPSGLSGGDLVLNTNGKSQGTTIEGVGNDALIYGWGLIVKGSANVEVRNLGFAMNDSSEGDCINIQGNSKNIFVHNCDFFYGAEKGDAKKGDSAIQIKKSNNITVSYNHYWDCGNADKLGGDGESGMCISYHHNWYDHADAALSQISYYSAHVYNNYFDSNAFYGIGSAQGASVFSELNYFYNCNYPMLISMQGNENGYYMSRQNGGIIKAYNNHMTGQSGFVDYKKNSTSFDAYDVAKKNAKVPGNVLTAQGNKSYNNFDASLYSYTADASSAARNNVMRYSGRMNGGDISQKFASDETTTAIPNATLLQTLKNYKGSLVSVGSADTGEGATKDPNYSETQAPTEGTTNGSESSSEGTSAGTSSGNSSNSGGSSSDTTDNTGGSSGGGGNFMWIILGVMAVGIIAVVVIKKKK